jgi:hypothetical protein
LLTARITILSRLLVEINLSWQPRFLRKLCVCIRKSTHGNQLRWRRPTPDDAEATITRRVNLRFDD